MTTTTTIHIGRRKAIVSGIPTKVSRASEDDVTTTQTRVEDLLAAVELKDDNQAKVLNLDYTADVHCLI